MRDMFPGYANGSSHESLPSDSVEFNMDDSDEPSSDCSDDRFDSDESSFDDFEGDTGETNDNNLLKKRKHLSSIESHS